jgi:hypothetical protein
VYYTKTIHIFPTNIHTKVAASMRGEDNEKLQDIKKDPL